MEKNALVRGASQYLATLKEAKEHLEDNQILLVGQYEIPQVASMLPEKQVVLLEYPTTVDKLSDAALQSTQTFEAYLNDAITYIPSAFFADTPLGIIKLPAKLKEIGAQAFFACASLGEIQIPETVELIGEAAFAQCFGLNDLVIPDTVKTIGTDAFAEIPHIIYHGTAEGAPWGARSMN